MNLTVSEILERLVASVATRHTIHKFGYATMRKIDDRQEAEQAIKDLFIELVGKDETQHSSLSVGVLKAQNELRAELRKKIEEL